MISRRYTGDAEQFHAAERRYAFRERLVMHLRVASFVVAVAMFLLGLNFRPWTPWFIASSVAIVGFCGAVSYHEHIRRLMHRNFILRQINEQAIARLDPRGTTCPKRRSKCHPNIKL